MQLWSPARPDTAWPGPARPGLAWPSLAQPSSAQLSSARPRQVQRSPAQPSPAQPSTAQSSPAQLGPARPGSAQALWSFYNRPVFLLRLPIFVIPGDLFFENLGSMPKFLFLSESSQKSWPNLNQKIN